MITKKKYKIKNNKPKKAVWGAVLGTAVNIGSNLIQKEKAEAQRYKEEMKAKEANHLANVKQDKFELEKYQTEGYGNVDFYKKNGGKLKSFYKTKGGVLKKVSNNMDKAVGNKHSESKIDNTTGIKLYKGKKAIAEVEDGEAIKNNKLVYSDKLKVNKKQTFADKALELASIKNKAKPSKKAKINKIENNLFSLQESLKKEKGIKNLPKKEKGGFIEKAIPFADNVVNAFLTANTPKLAKPILTRQKNLKTKVNVNPQLQNVNDAVDKVSKNISNRTSNSNVARNNITSARLQATKQKSNILANKENQETQLQNTNQTQLQNTANRNNSIINNHNFRQTERANNIQSSISKNAANATGDVIDNINRDKEEKFRNKELEILKNMYNSGTTRRADLKNKYAVEDMKKNPENYKDIYKGTPDWEKFKRATGYTESTNGLSPNLQTKKANITNSIIGNNTILNAAKHSELNLDELSEDDLRKRGLTDEEIYKLKRNKISNPLFRR